MIILDIIILLIVIFFAYKGFKNGLVKELGSLIALIAGVFLAIRFSGFIASLLSDKANFTSEYLPILSFSIIFIAIVVVVLVFSKILDQFMKLIKMQWLNKIAGIVFASIKAIIMLGGLFYMISLYNQHAQLFNPEAINKSHTIKTFTIVFEAIFPYTDHLKI